MGRSYRFGRARAETEPAARTRRTLGTGSGILNEDNTRNILLVAILEDAVFLTGGVLTIGVYTKVNDVGHEWEVMGLSRR